VEGELRRLLRNGALAGLIGFGAAVGLCVFSKQSSAVFSGTEAMRIRGVADQMGDLSLYLSLTLFFFSLWVKMALLCFQNFMSHATRSEVYSRQMISEKP